MNYKDFLSGNSEMIMKVEVNQLHIQFQPKEYQIAHLVEIC